MDIWVLSGSYEGDPFVSTHIQRNGALVAAILDVYDFMGVNDREEWKTYFEVRGGYSMATDAAGYASCNPLFWKPKYILIKIEGL